MLARGGGEEKKSPEEQKLKPLYALCFRQQPDNAHSHRILQDQTDSGKHCDLISLIQTYLQGQMATWEVHRHRVVPKQTTRKKNER